MKTKILLIFFGVVAFAVPKQTQPMSSVTVKEIADITYSLLKNHPYEFCMLYYYVHLNIQRHSDNNSIFFSRHHETRFGLKLFIGTSISVCLLRKNYTELGCIIICKILWDLCFYGYPDEIEEEDLTLNESCLFEGLIISSILKTRGFSNFKTFKYTLACLLYLKRPYIMSFLNNRPLAI